MNKIIMTNDYGEKIEKPIYSGVNLSGVLTATKKDSVNENFRGFGVALTGSSCYNLSLMEKSERAALFQSIYGKDGIGLSVARLTIGASDYSAEIYSYDDVTDDTALKHFSIAKDMKYIVPIVKEIIDINPDIKFFASPWSPPAWMKTEGSMGGGFMRRKYIECYADYFVKYIEAYKEQGITVSAVTPQNEAETTQQGKMTACMWHPELEAEFAIILKEKFVKKGIETKIWFYDHNFNGIGRVMWCLQEYPELVSALDGIAFHYYGGGVEQTRVLKEKYPKLKLHFTEGGPRLYDNYATDYCKWTLMMIKALSSGYSSFTGWNLMLDETGGPNVGPFFCGGLVTRNSQSGELSYSGQYKAFAHLAPYITENSEIFPLDINDQWDEMFIYNGKREFTVEGLLIKNNDKETLVFVNPKDSKAQIQYEKEGKWYYIELLPKTVATVIFED